MPACKTHKDNQQKSEYHVYKWIPMPLCIIKDFSRLSVICLLCQGTLVETQSSEIALVSIAKCWWADAHFKGGKLWGSRILATMNESNAAFASRISKDASSERDLTPENKYELPSHSLAQFYKDNPILEETWDSPPVQQGTASIEIQWQ